MDIKRFDENAALTTLKAVGKSEITEKKSVFIGEATPLKTEEQALAIIQSTKALYPDARHVAFAFTVGRAVRCSDDGEPQGTAGIPILDVLKKKNIDMALITVTRYFGGILLGAPGLVRAYTKAAVSAVADCGIITYQKCVEFTVECMYGDIGKMKYELLKIPCVIDNIIYGNQILIKAASHFENIERTERLVSELTSGKGVFQITGSRFDIIE